jgi:hypothetical protein
MSDTSRQATSEEMARWNSFQNHVERTTFGLTASAQRLGTIAIKMRTFLTTLPVSVPQPIGDNDLVSLKDIANREAILQRLIAKVLSKQYMVQFVDGQLNIVSGPNATHESVQSDIYPEYGTFGFAPIIIVAIIAGITLLIAGDQASDHLDKEAKIEALKLQQQMIATDQAMASAPPDVKASYEKWKSQNATSFTKAVEGLTSDGKEKGFIERFLGSGPTMALIIGGLLIGGALAYAKSRRD